MSTRMQVPRAVDLVVTGGEVLTPDGGWREADVEVSAGRVVAVRSTGATRTGGELIDARGRRVAPGFVDLQCNGAGGIDLAVTPERLWEVARMLPRWGVTAWLPTIVTAPDDIRTRARAALAAGPPPELVGSGRPWAEPLGLHFEGPFLAAARRGAHDLQHLQEPSLDAVADWSRDTGVALVTLAPELPGAPAVIDALAGRGVVVSAGHSDATAHSPAVSCPWTGRWPTSNCSPAGVGRRVSGRPAPCRPPFWAWPTNGV